MTIQGQAFRAIRALRWPAPLPVEIGFLAAHGIPRDILEQAAEIAERTGVSPSEALLKNDLVGEDEFYRALARETGLPFHGAALDIHPMTAFPQSILAGLVPLRERPGAPRFAVAPCGDDLVRLLARAPRFDAEVAVTTRSALRREVLRAKGREVAARASSELARVTPHLCSFGGSTGWQIAAAAALAGLLAFFATLSLAATGWAVMLVSSVIFLGMVVPRLAATLQPAPIAPAQAFPRTPDRDLPVYTVIVPMYRETRVLERVVAAMSALDYPRAKLDIKLVIEADDIGMREAVAGMDLPGMFEVVVAPPGEPRTKPRACNVALALARGEFAVIYDAEDVPQADQLRLAVATFRRSPPDVACLQARLVIDNTDDSWLTRFFTIEYATLFDVINPGLAWFGLPVPLGGTSNHFRTAILQSLYGWDAWNVTEDADLGMRLALAGYAVADLPSSTLEEAPSRLKAWTKQRSRWMKGYGQVVVTHSRRPLWALRKLGPVRFFGAVSMTLGTIGTALIYPFFTAAALVSLATGSLSETTDPMDAFAWGAGATLFGAGALAMTAPAVVALHRRGWWHLLPYVPLLPFYYALISIAAWRGVAELTHNPHSWSKTEHGLARTSRSGLLRSGSRDPGRLRPVAGRG